MADGAPTQVTADRPVVVLLNRDLRVHDHPALWAACSSAPSFVPLFVADPTFPTQRTTSSNRVSFLFESLVDLRGSLSARGGQLFVRRGDPVEEAMKVARAVDASAVFVTEDVSRTAVRRQERLARACAGAGHRYVAFPGTTVVPAGQLVPAGRDHYAVFTPYWRKWRASVWRPSTPTPRRVVVPSDLSAGRLASADFHDARPVSPLRAHGGETTGRSLTTAYLRRARAHARVRGGDPGDGGGTGRELPGDDTSRLSAYLHFGCVSALEVAQRGRADESFLRQLCWRDFHHQVTAAFPAVASRDYRVRARRWRHDPDALEAWQDGRTGIPVVDAGMRQLRLEGFMPGRARLLAAAYLVKELGLDWRLGAAHFSDWLVDADVANNSGNWQWVAGTGNDTRPNRTFNLLRQSYRHDPDGVYVRRYVPELAGIPGRAVHAPWRLPEARRRVLGYPDPLTMDHSEW
jgi:deoxyribodipyrimidine photo-lyase